MRILFVGFNARYINPTNQLAIRMLKLLGDVEFFGPGFIQDEELEKGLDSFLENSPDFDFVFTTTQIALNSDGESAENFYRNFSICNWQAKSSIGFIKDAHQVLLRGGLTTVVLVLDLDPYAIQHAEICKLDEISDYIVGLGEKFALPRGELRYLTSERLIREKEKTHTLGLWYDYCTSKKEKFINLGHFVGTHEFDFNPLNRRSVDISVPGQPYHVRAEMLKRLKHEKNLTVGHTYYRLAYSFMSKVGLFPFSNTILHSVYRVLFRDLLCSSKLSMTDGGPYEFFVRKFVEIPAAGSVLLARPCTGFESLGYKFGVSAIEIDPERPVEQVMDLLNNLPFLQKIAQNGRELVWNSHSIQARANQVGQALAAISEGRFRGSTWANGQFRIVDDFERRVP
jgi:hypothetical protein